MYYSFLTQLKEETPCIYLRPPTICYPLPLLQLADYRHFARRFGNSQRVITVSSCRRMCVWLLWWLLSVIVQTSAVPQTKFHFTNLLALLQRTIRGCEWLSLTNRQSSITHTYLLLPTGWPKARQEFEKHSKHAFWVTPKLEDLRYQKQNFASFYLYSQFVVLSFNTLEGWKNSNRSLELYHTSPTEIYIYIKLS